MPEKGRRILDMDRLKDSSLKETDPSDDLAPETFDEGAPFPGLGCIRESHGEGGLGKVKEKGAGKDQGLENFEKSDPDTCGHIACMVKGKRGGKTVGGIAPVVDPGVKGLSAGPSCDPADPIEMSHFGKEDSRILEAILKPSMVGGDSLELRDLPGEIVALPEEVSDRRCGKGAGLQSAFRVEPCLRQRRSSWRFVACANGLYHSKHRGRK